MSTLKVGFVGLGSMGLGMAESLLRAGFQVTAYNRTASKAAPLLARGATVGESLADLEGVDVLCTMLSDDASVKAVCLNGGALSLPLRSGAVHLSHSTISPDCAGSLAAAHSSAGVHYVGAPVMGRPDRAAAGALSIIASGSPEAIEIARPAMEAMSARIFEMGEDPAMANFAKLGMNYMLACALEAMSEGFAMVRKSGIEPDAFLELVTGSLFNAPAYNVYGPLVAHEVCETPGFKTVLGLKDLELAVKAAESIGAGLPMATPIRMQMKAAIESGYADRDWTSLARMAARAAGLPAKPDHESSKTQNKDR